ncbi:MAG: sulfite exporter TauE/SafE family protein [Micavibrio sp.]|nr:sulfite exporter TauE/SafE family protein [Micavibrio sp.]MBK9562076.1 sulfite exporter TauE/SafE family protein [Micavibrio sp.]
MIWLPISFFITAALYASVGFAGGSTYNALLVLAGTDYRILPTIALLCNLIVACGGTYRFARAGHVEIVRIAPWIVTSVPAAWLGGYLHVSETVFVGLLGLSLLAAGLRMFFKKSDEIVLEKSSAYKWKPLAPLIGMTMGLLAGLVGIGGGIFLAPVLHLLRWDNAKKIAAMCSVFILVNSIAGLAGQAMKLSDTQLLADITPYWILFPAVLIGGQIGSYMGVVRLNPDMLRVLTALLILYVSGRLLLRWYGMVS